MFMGTDIATQEMRLVLTLRLLVVMNKYVAELHLLWSKRCL
jgi:hypothetical protein